MYLKRIGELREGSDVKQVKLAAYHHVKQSTYSDYENGKINIPIDAPIKIADFYQASLDCLVGRSEVKELR